MEDGARVDAEAHPTEQLRQVPERWHFNHVESFHSSVSRLGCKNAARCGGFRQRQSVTQATLMRTHGCSAVKTVRTRQQTGLKSTAVGMYILKKADRHRKLARAKARTPAAKVYRRQRKRKETLDSEFSYVVWQQIGAVQLKHGIPDTTRDRLKLYQKRWKMRVWARELAANRRAMPKSKDAQVKYQLEQGPLGDVENDPTHSKHVPMTTEPLKQQTRRARQAEESCCHARGNRQDG